MNNIFQMAIRLLLMVVFLGYIMIWIMMPTNTFYLQWLPNIYSKTESTYFGNQGGDILIYTFPILFIATLSCLYLHLGKKNAHLSSTQRLMKNQKWVSWNRPVLVRGPLGIVKWTELSFLIMFIALLVWSFSSYLHAMFANISQETAQNGELMWERKLESAALMLGLVGNICLAFLFFPVTRGSSILQFIGLTSEASIKYHIWLGHLIMILFTSHGLCYIVFWANTHQISQMLKWEKIGISNLAGEVALLCGLVMWSTSLHSIRRKSFELFFYTHHLHILFVVFFVFHVGFSFSCIVLPSFYLFLIDRFLRFLQSQHTVRLLSARVLPSHALELNFCKTPGLSYSPASIVFVNVPSLSKLQWHPFTVTSNCNMDPEMLSIVIKCEGSWSNKLYEKLSSPSSADRLEVSVEGPYGPASSHHLLRHDMVVMVSGGSGITPFISIIRELISTTNMENIQTPQSVLLVCAFKNSVDLTMLNLLLPATGTPLDISHLNLQINAYITREKEPPINNQNLPHHTTIWFKPNAQDAPLSSVLGTNNWLWLGAIISMSFVIFLMILAVVTRYYIYPIDKNSNFVFSHSLKSAMNMLFICVGIVIAASAAFVWNKKENCKEMRQISISSDYSMGGVLFSGERELERFSNHQSWLQPTKVHYGERPDLKKILRECKGTSTGVLVSGPRKMRQEVAAMCSSNIAHNLHFESISFTW